MTTTTTTLSAGDDSSMRQMGRVQYNNDMDIRNYAADLL